jgi:hypothetical protein
MKIEKEIVDLNPSNKSKVNTYSRTGECWKHTNCQKLADDKI